MIPFFTGKVGSKKAGGVKRKNLDNSQNGLASKTSKLKASTSESKNGGGSCNNVEANFEIGDIVISSDEDFL